MAHHDPKVIPKLHIAVEAGDEAQILRCIRSGCDVNLRDFAGQTAILLANYRDTKIIRILLEAGAEHTVAGMYRHWSQQPINLATSEGNLECIDLLLSAGADINFKCADGFTPLHVAVSHKRMDTVKFLVERGANMHDDYLVRYAGSSIYGNEELIDYLLQKGAPVVWNDDEGWRVLRRVVRMENPEFTRRVIALGANVNATGYENDTENEEEVIDEDDTTKVNALMLAMRYSTVEHVGILLENGADLDDPMNDFGSLYLNYAAFDKLQIGKVEELLKSGKNVNHRDEKTGRPLLVLALDAFDPEEITLFLDYGADITAKDGAGKSVIEHAVTTPRDGTQNLNIFESLAPFIYHGEKIDTREVELIMSSKARTCYERCVPELERLKSLKFYGNLSLLNMLVSTIYKLTDYARNTELVDAFYEHFDEDDYLVYKNWLSIKFDKAYMRMEQLEPVAAFFSQVFGFNDPQHLVNRRIMSYLTDYELYRIADALRAEISQTLT